MQVGLLGPMQVVCGGEPVRVRSPSQRLVLALLALQPGRVLQGDELIDALWPDELPAKPSTALQIQISRVRKLVPGDAVLTTESGYLLDIDPLDTDVGRVASMHTEARSLAAAGDLNGAIDRGRRAAAEWRGEPFSDVPDSERISTERIRLADLRISFAEEVCRWQLDAEVDLAEPTARLEELVAEAPLRESATGLLMQALYRSGRQSEALERFQRLRRRLAEELGVQPSPALAALELAILTHDGSMASGSRAAAPPADARPPAPVTTFVGRERDSKRLLSALGQHRLVTLTGPGGAGKTRLVTEIFDELATDGVSGVGGAWFASLAAVEQAPSVPVAVADALGLEGAAGTDPLALLERTFADQAGVIVLDNCEHVLDAAADLAHRMLTSCPQLRVLATSREPLDIQGERIEPLGGLQQDADDAAEAEAEAERLFVERAGARGPLPDRAVVRRLCNLVDGWPLAIELLAANAGELDLTAAADEVEAAINAVATPYRDVVDRHASLAATLDWSYRLLGPDLQVAYRVLGMFDGPISPDAVAAVFTGLAVDAEPWSAVERLAARSLLVLSADGRSASMLRPIVQHARSVAADAADVDAPALSFVEYYDVFTRDVDRELDSSDGPTWIGRLRHEERNVLRAIEIALAADRWASAAAIGSQAGFGWMLGSRQLIGIEALERISDRASDQLAWTSRRDIGQTLGYLYGSIGRYAPARTHLTTVLELQEGHGDVRRVTTLGNLTGIVEQDLDLRRALELLDDARALLPAFTEEVGPERATSSRSSLATKRASVLAGLGRYEEAVDAAEEARQAADGLGGYWWMTSTGALANAHLGAGDAEAARAVLAELDGASLADAQLHRSRGQLAASLRSALALLDGDLDDAIDHSTAALALVEEHEVFEITSCLRTRSEAQLRRGDHGAAIATIRRCLDLVVDGEMGEVVPVMLDHAARALLPTDPDLAATIHRAGEIVRERTGCRLAAWVATMPIDTSAAVVAPDITLVDAARLAASILTVRSADLGRGDKPAITSN